MMKESNRCRLGPQVGTAVQKEKNLYLGDQSGRNTIPSNQPLLVCKLTYRC